MTIVPNAAPWLRFRTLKLKIDLGPCLSIKISDHLNEIIFTAFVISWHEKWILIYVFEHGSEETTFIHGPKRKQKFYFQIS